jgi:hypothetical protein
VYTSKNKKQSGSSSGSSSSSAERSTELLSLRLKQGTVWYSTNLRLTFVPVDRAPVTYWKGPGFRSWLGTMLNGMETSGLPQYLESNARITQHRHSCTL